MDFKNMPLKSISLVSLAAICLVGFMVMKFSCKTDSPAFGNNVPQDPLPSQVTMPPVLHEPPPVASDEENTGIARQLERDRQQQKQTKELKIRLEQTNLELEQEKSLAEINKLKKENMETFNDPAEGGQNDLPEIRVDYIGGDSVKKEAILSIGGASFQVKEKSSPAPNIQVLSISDSGVVLHFSGPQDLTKTIDYKPE